MSFSYKSAKSRITFVKFFIAMLILSFLIYIIGRVITEFIQIVVFSVFVPNGIGTFSQLLTAFTIPGFWVTIIIPYLTALPLMIIAGLIVYGLSLMTLGAKLMTWVYIRIARGWIGRLLSKLPIFDFDGLWIVEKRIGEEVNLDSWTHMFKELIGKRGWDIIGFPTLIAVFIVVLIEKILPNTAFNLLVFNGVQVPFSLIDFVTMGVAFLVVILLCLYIPSMWILKDGEIKKIDIGRTGDVDGITHISSSFAQGLSLFIGFSAFIGLGELAIRATKRFAEDVTNTSVILTTSDKVIVYLATYVHAIGFFLIIASWLLPAFTIGTARYLQHHAEHIANTRKKIVEKGLAKARTVTHRLTD